MNVVDFDPAHLAVLDEQYATAYLRQFQYAEDYARLREASQHAYTGMVDGRPVVCGGITHWWNGVGEMWAVFSKDAGPHMVASVRAAKRILDMANCHRVSAAVDATFVPGQRLVRALGFGIEGRMRGYGPDGRDYFLYARAR
jgi:hypothetical protein